MHTQQGELVGGCEPETRREEGELGQVELQLLADQPRAAKPGTAAGCDSQLQADCMRPGLQVVVEIGKAPTAEPAKASEAATETAKSAAATESTTGG